MLNMQPKRASRNCLSKNDQVMLGVIESEGALKVGSYHTMPQGDADSLFGCANGALSSSMSATLAAPFGCPFASKVKRQATSISRNSGANGNNCAAQNKFPHRTHRL